MHNIKFFLCRFGSFSCVGIICTLLTVLGIALLSGFFKFNIYLSYSASYLVTIILSYVLNMHWVFKKKIALSEFFFYVAIYLSSLLVGVVFLYILQTFFPLVEKTFLGYATIPLTTIYNFLFVTKLANRNF